MRIIRFLLFPFAFIYGIVTGIRNYLYNLGYIQSHSFPIPIIKVGNLNTGGTGKTPMTQYLATSMPQSKKVGILSRGYRRKTRGFIKANANSKASEIGDEPLLLYNNVPGVEIAVCEDRKVGIENITQGSTLDLIILDDAFQQRRIIGNIEILLTTYAQPYYNDLMLPTGNLREFISGRKRADLIIVTKCPPDIDKAEMEGIKEKLRPFRNQKVLFSILKYNSLQQSINANDQADTRINIILVTGIANAKGLKNHLSGLYNIEHHFEFRDHHPFSSQDLHKIHHTHSNAPDNTLIVTTEKDWVKIEPLLSAEYKKHWVVQTIEVEFLDGGEKDLRKVIDDKIKSNESII
ncbi:MAG TPA: tetraacyldisaccharide 4'-kinase [Flavobacteriales bacterium]|jgi:tetraacyldisaccharide 4'-kinase|nr:tetraacyldisaccharide 4'-kinase [Flavobacteriales bacterium]